jgi:hypothetical protein
MVGMVNHSVFLTPPPLNTIGMVYKVWYSHFFRFFFFNSVFLTPSLLFTIGMVVIPRAE